jgi:biopolymer transport protein ExbD
VSFQSQDEQEGIFDINVTPFVDVLLVLLVIFMVTTPLMVQQSLRVNLPNSKTSDSVDKMTLSVVITSQGQYLLNGQATDLGSITAEAKKMFATNQNLQVIFAADLESQHKYIVEAMDQLRQTGITKFAFQVLQQE